MKTRNSPSYNRSLYFAFEDIK